jgi:alkanesulfonate monooxygenase SsuD/methylene tetrahydromethanopterin reductase-like flavin-dependent oxidoreductase (luciferase family)
MIYSSMVRRAEARLSGRITGAELRHPAPILCDFSHAKSSSGSCGSAAFGADRPVVGVARGHFTFAATPEQVADVIEDWFRDGAADGFNVMPPLFPGQLDAFIDGIIPILQKRGLFRTEYTGTTLRDHYGLERPAARFFEEKAAAE